MEEEASLCESFKVPGSWESAYDLKSSFEGFEHAET